MPSFECESALPTPPVTASAGLTLTSTPGPRGHKWASKLNINQQSIVINVARALWLILRYLVNLKFMWTFPGIFSPRNVKYLLLFTGFTVTTDVTMMLGWASLRLGFLMTHYPFTVISSIICLGTIIFSNTIILTFYLFLNCLTKCPVMRCGQLAGVRG